MSIRYVENTTNGYIPFDRVVAKNPHPTFARHFAPDGSFPHGPPPARSPGGFHPGYHELRPGERYYWIEDDFPAPPPPEDPRWDKIRLFLFNTINHGALLDSRLRAFTEDVWTDALDGETKWSGGSRLLDGGGLSVGHVSRFYQEHYSNQAADATPAFRTVGWEPWGDGIAAGNHYSSALWCLENYMRLMAQGRVEEAARAWQRYVLVTLHHVGQGWDHLYGAPLYEKSPWIYAGLLYARGHLLWSHMWVENVLFFNMMTGELGDVVSGLLNYGWFNPHYSTEYWGPRGVARYLRALRSVDLVLPDHINVDDTRAHSVIDDLLDEAEARGRHYFTNLGAIGNIDVWQDWDCLAEAMALAIQNGWDDIYPRLKPIAEFHLANHMTPEGQSAYYKDPSGHVRYRGFLATDTSVALPFMAEMVRRGDLDQSVLRKSWDLCMERLPYDDVNARQVAGLPRRGRGVLWKSPDKQSGERPWGGACLKVANITNYGFRGDVEKVALR